MGFEEEYQAFMNTHLQARTGERLRRLQEGHNLAEKLLLKQVWCGGLYFTTFGIFIQNMKLNDFKDGKRYLNFAYTRPAIRICFEVDGMVLT